MFHNLCLWYAPILLYNRSLWFFECLPPQQQTIFLLIILPLYPSHGNKIWVIFACSQLQVNVQFCAVNICVCSYWGFGWKGKEFDRGVTRHCLVNILYDWIHYYIWVVATRLICTWNMFTFAMSFSLHSIFMFVLIFYHYNQILLLMRVTIKGIF